MADIQSLMAALTRLEESLAKAFLREAGLPDDLDGPIDEERVEKQFQKLEEKLKKRKARSKKEWVLPLWSEK